MPYVVDANVINSFQYERISGQDGVAVAAIEYITSSSFIAVDADGQCEHEWISCAAGAHPFYLKDWLADMLASSKIRMFPFSCESMFKELNSLGIPKKDHKWIRVNRSSGSEYLVTEDIDLIHPEMKKASSAKKAAIKQTCNGPVAKYLKKHYNIVVMCCAKVCE